MQCVCKGHTCTCTDDWTVAFVRCKELAPYYKYPEIIDIGYAMYANECFHYNIKQFSHDNITLEGQEGAKQTYYTEEELTEAYHESRKARDMYKAGEFDHQMPAFEYVKNIL